MPNNKQIIREQHEIAVGKETFIIVKTNTAVIDKKSKKTNMTIYGKARLSAAERTMFLKALNDLFHKYTA